MNAGPKLSGDHAKAPRLFDQTWGASTGRPYLERKDRSLTKAATRHLQLEVLRAGRDIEHD